jgi:hypothetical protein
MVRRGVQAGRQVPRDGKHGALLLAPSRRGGGGQVSADSQQVQRPATVVVGKVGVGAVGEQQLHHLGLRQKRACMVRRGGQASRQTLGNGEHGASMLAPVRLV